MQILTENTPARKFLNNTVDPKQCRVSNVNSPAVKNPHITF